MRKKIRLFMGFVMLVACETVLAHQPPLAVAQNSLAPMLKNATPAVVNVYTEEEKLTKLNTLIQTQDDQTKIPVKSYAVGSGVIFDASKGLIVTNAHVIKHEKMIVITLKNGERYHAALIAKSDAYDIAILKIHAEHLTALTFANSDEAHVGDYVTAIGSPYGLTQTVTSGVISALNRSHPQIEGYQSFIQTDAPINPGNSGGALVNMQGQLLGINTALVGPSDQNSGIGFSIPSNMAKSVIEQLLKYGKVQRGVIGVLTQDMTPALADALHLQQDKGSLISDVLPNTPASRAGMQKGDIITDIDHHPVHDAVQLRNMMGLIRPGTTVDLTYIRDHQIKNTTLEVGDPKKMKQAIVPYWGGMRLQTFHELESDGMNLRGIIVTQVSDDSAGALADIQSGDIINEINNKTVSTLSELQKASEKQTKPLLLSISRDNKNIFIMLNAE